MKVNKSEKVFRWIKKIVVWITLLFMPLSTYTTPIDGVTWADVLVILGTFLIMFYIIKEQMKLNKFITWDLILYIAFILVHSCVFWAIKPNEIREGILGVIRYLLYIFWVGISAKKFFDIKYAYKIYKILAIIFAIYAVMQFVSFNLFKITLPINVLGFPAVSSVEKTNSTEKIAKYIETPSSYRPYSVFIEPAYFSVYLIPILYMILNNVFGKEKKSTRYIIGVLFTVALVLTKSTTGIALALLCWIRPIYKEIKENRKSIFIFIILFIIGIICLFCIPSFRGMFNRIINENGTIGKSVFGRFSNMHILFDGTMKIEQIIFGQGMWVNTDYLPSIGTMITSFGIIGLIGIIGMIIYAYKRTNEIGKFMAILMLILFIGTNTLFNISSVLMFTLIYVNIKDSEEKNDSLRKK